MKSKFSWCHLPLMVLLWLVSSAYALTESIPLDQSVSFDCSIVTEPPAINKETCQEYVVNRQSAASGLGKIKVAVCPVAAADPENKEYFIYTSSSNWPWLCRREEKREGSQQTAPPTLTITIADEQTDVPGNEVPAVFGGGYGSDSFDAFDDRRPRKPRIPGGGVAPFLLETVSAGLLPAGILPFAFDLELPGLASSAPIIFQQGLMSDNSEILVIVFETQQKFYQRASLFSHWQLMGQTNVNGISSVEWNSEDDFLAENKLVRALVGAFGWKYNICAKVPGLLVCPKRGEETQSHRGQGQSTSSTRSTSSDLPRDSRQAQRGGDSRKSSDDQKRRGDRVQHVHQGPSCPHPDCCPGRCRCTECQAARNSGISIGQTVSVQQALSAVGECGYKYMELGFLLGVPYDRLSQMSIPFRSRIKATLELAQEFGLLTRERLVMVMSVVCGGIPAEKAAVQLGVPYSNAIPDCYLENARPDIDDAMSPRDALLIASDFSISHLAVEMGLPDEDRETVEKVRDFGQRKLELLWQLQQNGLLTYGRFLSAVSYLGNYGLALETSQKLGLELRPRQPDYQVFPGNRLEALTQPLSLRDLVDIVPCHISEVAVAQSMGCPNIAQSVSHHRDVSERMLNLLALCMEHKDGIITVNEVIKMFYHPELMLWKNARRLQETLTGQSSNREVLEVREVMGFKYLDNLEAFGTALGLPERLMASILTRRDNQLLEVFIQADELDRLTPENLVYALEQSGNGHRVASVKRLVGITAQQLPNESPVYLSEGESGPIFEEPMEGVEVRSVPLTLENCGGLPLSHNWYWIGLAMGLSRSELVFIEKDCHYRPVDCLYKMLGTLIRQGTYETGHLYNVLLFLDDQEAIQAFPAHLKGEPKQALASLVLSSSMAHALITLAGALKHHPEAFGRQLNLSNHVIGTVLDDHKRDPRRTIVELIQKSIKQSSCNRSDLLDRLVTAAIALDKAEMKINLLEAMDWATRKADQLWPQAGVFSGLASAEQKLRQKLQTAALASLKAPPEFICPITLDLVKDPVAVQMGDKTQVFERKALQRWVGETGRNPLTNLPLQWSEVQECPEIMLEMHEWLESLP